MQQKAQRGQIRIKVPNMWDVAIFLICFILVIPDGLNRISQSAYKFIYGYGLYAIYVAIIFLFLIRMTEKRAISKIFLPFMLFCAFSIAVAFFVRGGFTPWYNTFSVCLFVALFCEGNSDRLDTIVLSFLSVLEFWIYLNLLLMLMYPDGMYYAEANRTYTNWILGYKSSLQYYVLPAICFSWINMKYRGQRIRYILLVLVSIAEAIVSENAMLIVGLAVLVVLQFVRLWEKGKLFRIWIYYIVDIVANITIVFFSTWFSNTSLGSLFLEMLGKDSTFTSRTSIVWPVTLEYIKSHFWFGNGVYLNGDRIFLYRGIPGLIHSHNQLLEIFFTGGVILFAIYIIMHISIGKQIQKYINMPSEKVLAVTIFVLYLMTAVEVFTRIVAGPIWAILYIAGMGDALHNCFIKRTDCILGAKH